MTDDMIEVVSNSTGFMSRACAFGCFLWMGIFRCPSP